MRFLINVTAIARPARGYGSDNYRRQGMGHTAKRSKRQGSADCQRADLTYARRRMRFLLNGSCSSCLFSLLSPSLRTLTYAPAQLFLSS
jgi:hypothetical protein